MTSQGCVNIGRSAALEDEAMVPEELKVLFYKTLEVEHRGMTEDGGDIATSAGDPHESSPVEGEMGPQKVMMVPEDENVTKVRWDGFRKQIGYEGDDVPMETQDDEDFRGPKSSTIRTCGFDHDSYEACRSQ